MNVLGVVIYFLVALGGTCVVLIPKPLPQSMMASIFSILLSILFLVLQAPDVSLSEMVVGAAVYPLMIILALSKTEGEGAE